MSRTTRTPAVIDWPCDVSGVDAAEQARALAAAESWLWALTGRRFGSFTTIEDRYRPPCSDPCGGPYKDAQGRWRNYGGDADWCCRLPLKYQPVRGVDEVRVYGEVVPAAEYVLEGSWLVRIGACWPCDDECDPAPVEVDYKWGSDWGPLGLAALGEMACEFVRGLTGENCKLPSRAIQVARQGVTIDLDDAQQFAENGLTGMPIADSFIRTVNPSRLVYRSRVFSPDVAGSR